MALAKSVDTVDAWTSIAVSVPAEGATKDLSACYQVTLHIDAGLTSATATVNGLGIVVQISSAASGDANWTDLTSFSMLAGLTATKASIANTIIPSNTVISTNALTGFTTKGVWQFIYDGASSEMVWEATQSAGGISILDGATYNHVSTTEIYAHNSGAAQAIAVNIPDTAQRVRVLYNNSLDLAGSTFMVRCNLSKVTSI